MVRSWEACTAGTCHEVGLPTPVPTSYDTATLQSGIESRFFFYPQKFCISFAYILRPLLVILLHVFDFFWVVLGSVQIPVLYPWGPRGKNQRWFFCGLLLFSLRDSSLFGTPFSPVFVFFLYRACLLHLRLSLHDGKRKPEWCPGLGLIILRVFLFI